MLAEIKYRAGRISGMASAKQCSWVTNAREVVYLNGVADGPARKVVPGSNPTTQAGSVDEVASQQ
jgi:hypothetical protein